LLKTAADKQLSFIKLKINIMNTYLVHPTREQEQLLIAFLDSNRISFLNEGEKTAGCVLNEMPEKI